MAKLCAPHCGWYHRWAGEGSLCAIREKAEQFIENKPANNSLLDRLLPPGYLLEFLLWFFMKQYDQSIQAEVNTLHTNLPIVMVFYHSLVHCILLGVIEEIML